MDSEQARELRQSLLWQELVKDLEDDINGLKEQLVNCAVPERVTRIQERILTIKAVINKPNSIIDSEE